MQSLRRLALTPGALQRNSFVLQGLAGELGSTQPAAVRYIGGGGVPDQWGQPQTGGTKFLGTPKNYMELTKMRPISPDLFGVDGKTHYKFPPVALSSITNRVTGCVLSGAVMFGGIYPLVGDLPAFVEAFKATAPFLVFPVKAGLSFPLVYHYMGGIRHLVWDATTMGIDNDSADKSSKALFAASAVVSAAVAAL